MVELPLLVGGVAVSGIVTRLLAPYLPGGVAVTAATVFVSAVVLVFGEIVPKAYGPGNKEE